MKTQHTILWLVAALVAAAKPKCRNLGLLAGCFLAFSVSQSGLGQALGGNASKPQSRTSVLEIEEGFVGTQRVLIYYKSFAGYYCF